MTVELATILDYTLEAAWYIDACRVVIIMIGGAMTFTIAFLLKDWRCLPYPRPQKARYLALMLYGLMSVLQQIQQFGKEAVIWRLSLILIAGVIAMYGLFAEGVKKYFVATEEKPMGHLQWDDIERQVEDHERMVREQKNDDHRGSSGSSEVNDR